MNFSFDTFFRDKQITINYEIENDGDQISITSALWSHTGERISLKKLFQLFDETELMEELWDHYSNEKDYLDDFYDDDYEDDFEDDTPFEKESK